MSATATFDPAPTAIALIGGSGTIERATAPFADHFGAEAGALGVDRNEVERILSGEVGRVPLTLEGQVAELLAAVAVDGRRYALLTVPRTAEPDDEDATAEQLRTFADSIDASPALVWLKDLEGRYLRVNHQYAARLPIDADQMRGKVDSELSPGASIEGLRQRAGDGVEDEPLELEYTTPAFDNRPAFAVLRFALRDRTGQPTAVCGVAAPLDEARLARSECERLMRIERWSRLDDVAIRAELLEDWGLVLEVGNGGPAHRSVDEVIAGLTSERDAALEDAAGLREEMEAAQRQVEEVRESAESAERELVEARQALERELTEAREALERELASAREAAEGREALEQELAEAREALERERSEREAAESAQLDDGSPHWEPAAQHALSAALTGVADWSAAMTQATKALGSEGGWDAAIAWCPDDRRGLMSCAAAWIRDPSRTNGLETRAWHHLADVASTEFGRARNRLAPTCLLELDTAEDPLLRAAAASGLHSAVLIPIRDGIETVAMLELLSSASVTPSPQVLLSLEGVALQLTATAQLLKLAGSRYWHVGRM